METGDLFARLRERVDAEVERVVAKNKSRDGLGHGGFASVFEAWAIVQEELDEFKEWVWRKPLKREPEKMLKELVQIAANLRVALVFTYHADQNFVATRLESIVCDTSRAKIVSFHDGYGRLAHLIEAWKASIFGFASDVTVRPSDAITHAESICFKTAMDLRLFA